MKSLRIALIGYGKMGHEIEKIALQKGHSVPVKITSRDRKTFNEIRHCDVAIEFTTPVSAVENILACFVAGIPVVTGTTGWNDRLEEVKTSCRESNGALLYSSNFSVGVNILFEINRRLASLMKDRKEYDISMEEIHHVHKLDKPSGTAITLADDILSQSHTKQKWVSDSDSPSPGQLNIISVREDEVPGTHTVKYTGSADELVITHRAFNRSGFASGAVLAAEFLHDKKGIYTMKDVLAL